MIPYGKQSITDEDVRSVTAALKSDWLTTGPLVEEFEISLEKIVGAPCVSVSSGTAALHCAYAAIELSPGDEIITPPITFIATQATASLLGAKIVFADVQADTGNIDPICVEKAITSRTKAIVAVDYAGNPADLLELRAIADKHGLFLLEDAAHSLGSTYMNKPVGSIADITTFSFFPTKNLTTAEGGAVASNDKKLLNRAKKFARQGLIRDAAEFQISGQGPWHQEVHEFGLNYRLPDVLCALGLSQLEKLNLFKQRRKEIHEKYNEAFKNIQELKLPKKHPNTDPMWHLYPIRVPAEKRLKIFNKLREDGIGVQVNYFPVHLQPVFLSQGFKVGDFPVSEKFYAEEISLPIHFSLSNEEQDKVISSLINCFSTKK